MLQKIVVVTRKTRLEELVERFNTKAQPKFYLEHLGQDFSDYEDEHEVYSGAVRRVVRDLDVLGPHVQRIDWGFLPTFEFARDDAVVAVGRDGLVVNTAKYLDGQGIVAVNPDPRRIDGILLPFAPEQAVRGVARVLDHRESCHEVTMAEVPDKPPRHFTWRRATHTVVRAEGPERIAMEWWRTQETRPTRDYFRVEDETGLRFWLYRDGLYGREIDPQTGQGIQPHWYMHGLFA